MAEEVVGAASADMAETPAGQSQPEQATSEPAPSDAVAPSEATNVPKKAEKVDLFQSEDFRRYQATQTKQIQAAQQRAQELERKLREQQVSGMNDYERAQFEAQEARNRAEELERQIHLRDLEASRQIDMQRLHEKAGIPLAELEKAETYEEAQEMAMDYLRSGIEGTIAQKVEEVLAAKTANAPDTGGGQPAPVVSDRDAAIQSAIANNDSVSFVAAILSEE